MPAIHADEWGPLGAIVTALCCLNVALVVGLLGALGLGFLVNDWLLLPLLAAFLGLTVWSVGRDRHRHGRPGPWRLAWAAAGLSFGGLWVHGSVTALGLAALVAASIWNLCLLRTVSA